MEINGHGIVKNPTEEGVSLTYIEGWEDASEAQHKHDVERVIGILNPYNKETLAYFYNFFEEVRQSILAALKAEVKP